MYESFTNIRMEKEKPGGMMKVLTILVVLFFGGLFGILPLAYPETIITKDGQAIKAVITEKTDDTIWYELEAGEITEEVGIDLADVESVLDDDGSLSEYAPENGE